MTPDRSGRRAIRIDPVLLSLAAAGGTGAAVLASGIVGRTTQLAVFWPLTAAFELVLCGTGLLLGRMGTLSRAHRRVWGSMGLAGLCYVVGVAMQVPTVLGEPGGVAAALGGTGYSVCVLVGNLAIVWSLLSTPLGLHTRRERLRFWFDAVTVMAAAATGGCYVAVALGSAGTSGTGETMQLVIGPTTFLVGSFAAVKLLLSPSPPFTFWAGTLGMLAGCLEGTVRGVRPLLIRHDLINWELALTVISVLLLATSARVQLLQVRHNSDKRRRKPRRPYSLLPYGAVAGIYALTIGVLVGDGLTTASWIVVIGATSSTLLVISRQLIAFTDNARLVTALDGTVTELRAALEERDRLAEQLRHQAFHDPLTGLANRALFQERRAALPAGAAVLLIDLDEFKPVNDRHGHAAGDQVLLAVARRLTAQTRESDLVARLGGDEFAVVTVAADDDDPSAMAARIVEAVREPIEVSGGHVTIGASVGVAIADGVRPVEQVLHEADLAMYAEKSRVRF